MDAAAFQGTEPLAAGSRIDEARLAKLVRERVDGVAGAMTVERFRGGQSNPTMLLGFAKGRKLVMRKKPDGTLLPSAHAVDREFRVLKALESSDVPVATPHFLCEDDSVAGAMFYVMDYVPGRNFWDPALPYMQRSERTAIFAEMRRVIAALHALDWQAAGLADFGRPENYLARQVARWSKQYRASETETIAAMDRLIDWLPANLPPQRRASLIHGDYRLDNLIFHPTEPRISAVVDWELSTLGDPIADFAYHTLTWHVPPTPFRGLEGLDLAGLGIPDAGSYRAGYFQALGEDEPSDREWNAYLAYSLFRVAAIRQGIMKRVVDGTAASAHAAAAGALARPTAERALAFAERADALS